MEQTRVMHEFAPVYDCRSRILILGTFPSVRSRQQKFYYGHPRNRFWQVIAELTGSGVPDSIAEKKELLLANRIAIWAVVSSCEITGSADSSIRNVQANDIAGLLKRAPIEAIYANGETAYRLYGKYCAKEAGMEAIRLPSTSPANAAWTLPRLVEAWRVILPDATGFARAACRGLDGMTEEA